MINKFIYSIGLFSSFLLGCSSQTSECEKWANGTSSNFIRSFSYKLEKPTVEVLKPDRYENSVISEKSTSISLSDTLTIPFNKKETIELEIIAKDSITFNDLSVEKDLRKSGDVTTKPKIWGNLNSFFVTKSKILVCFKPWMYVPYGDGGTLNIKITLSKNNQCTTTKYLPIKVLSDSDYTKYINRRLNDKDYARKNLLEKKYKKEMEKCWSYESWGNRNKHYSMSFNLEKFRKRNPQFKQGVFSNEYVAKENGFEVRIVTGDNESITIEPIK